MPSYQRASSLRCDMLFLVDHCISFQASSKHKQSYQSKAYFFDHILVLHELHQLQDLDVQVSSADAESTEVANVGEFKISKSNIDIDNVSDFKSYPDVNDISFHDELKGYDNIEDSNNDNISFYDNNFSIHDKPIENYNAISIKSTEEIKELDNETNIDVDNNANEQLILDDNVYKQLDNEIKSYNWYNKIPDALESLMLDIKKEKTNSEV
ncbi:5887_t:CDS:2 [Funneliformis caledonium]|uniref:5887_t:CDS:1 n=1 Tax=Funneliformis caledonium TaxID=1117310 RepID=A0A9N9GRD3_9GLOM|nr:5887_t:CDS:2 [Funneliformis caledonium]